MLKQAFQKREISTSRSIFTSPPPNFGWQVLLFAVLIIASFPLPAQAELGVPPDNQEYVLNKANTLVERLKFDSALFYLEPLLVELEKSGLKDSPLGLRTQLAMSYCWEHTNLKVLSMQLLNELKDKSRQLEQWDVYVKVCLNLTGMHGKLARKEEVKANLDLAHDAIVSQKLDSLFPDYTVALATWHGDFGYNDSLKHYTRLAMEALESVDRPRLMAAAHTLDFYSITEEDYREGIASLRKTIPIFKRLGDNIAQSRSWYKISLAYYRGGDIEKSIIYNDSTIAAYYLAIEAGSGNTPVLSATYRATGAGREDTPILAAAYLVRGRAYRRLNQLDSALYYTRRGYTEEIRFIKQKEKYRIAEVAEKYNAQGRELQLKEKAQELAYVHQRTRGLNIITGICLLFASFVIYAYSKLRKSNDTAKSQAAKLKDANENLSTSLKQQVMLQAEIHHRVKNNLQIISSLLQSQSDIANDERITRIIAEGQERIRSMALIHQNLYQSDDLSNVHLKSYLNELVTNIQRSHAGASSSIDLELRVEDERLELDAAIPVGLILNELITNAYKYAFPDGKAGKIIVELSKKAKSFTLRVSDNGVGLPGDLNLRKSKSLGLNLVTGLVRQLKGSISWSKEAPGTTIAIKF